MTQAPTAATVGALLDLRRWDGALAALAPMIAVTPDDGMLHCLAARARLGLGDAPGALDAADRGAALLPDAEYPQRLRSIALLREGRARAAADAAREAVRLAPDSWSTHFTLGQALLGSRSRRQRTDGLAAARQAVVLAPHEARAVAGFGSAYLACRQPALAEQCFTRALALDPQDAEALNGLGRADLVRHRYGRAAVRFGSALQSSPQLSAPRDNLRVVFVRALQPMMLAVFIGAFVVVQAAPRHPGSSALAARVTAAVVVALSLAVGAWGVVHFRAGQDAGTRGYYRRLLARDGRLLLGMALQAAALGLLLAVCLAPPGVCAGLAGAAALGSLVGRAVFLRLGGRRPRRRLG